MRPGVRKLAALARTALALALLGLAVGLNRDQIVKVWNGRPDPSLFARGMAFYLAGLWLAYVRWFILVRAIGLPFRLRDAVRLGLIGALFNFVIPGAVFGNVVKAAFLCKEQPDRQPDAIASVVADFLCGVLGLFLLAACVGTSAGSRLEPGLKNLVIFAWAATGVTAAMLAIGVWKGRAGAYRGRKGMIVAAVAMALGTHALSVLAFHAVSRAMFGPMVPGLAQHFLLVPLVLFTTAVPLPFGALGLSEQASFALFRLMNYSGGAVAMLGFRILQFSGAGLGAIMYMTNARQIRELTASEVSRIEPEAIADGAGGSIG